MQTYYSKDNSGVYYKMVLTWNGSGNVTVNRTIITGGYPAGTDMYFGVESGINCRRINVQPDSSNYDTLRVFFARGRTYFMIGFEPNTHGGYEEYPMPGGNGAQSDFHCECTGGTWGVKCGMKGDSNKFYCGGCQHCDMCRSGIVGLDFGGMGAAFYKNAGARIVEASGITIIN